MKLVIALLAGFLFLGTAQAQRIYNQGELDAMLAPIALQPDGVVSQVLIASTYPEEVAAAARWSRANPHMRGNDALRAVQNEPWDPAVKALLAFPELLIRMDESPQWLRELGEAFLQQEAHVMETVQALRRRAQAAGNLATTDQNAVYQQDEAIVVEPRTQIVYVRYYDPYVVYGPWWWPYYRPVFWRPWAPRPVFVTHGFFYSKPDWRGRHVNVVHRPVHVQRHHHQVVPGRWQPSQRQALVNRVTVQPHVRVPESQRRPVVQQRPIVQQQMPAANGFTHPQQRGESPQHRGREDANRNHGEREARTAPPRQQQREGQHQRGNGSRHRG